MRFLAIMFLLLFSTYLQSKDLVTLGYTGSVCKDFNEGVEIYVEDFEKGILLAHLTGINVASS